MFHSYGTVVSTVMERPSQLRSLRINLYYNCLCWLLIILFIYIGGWQVNLLFMILVDSTCHCSLWRLTTIHFLVYTPSKTAEMEEKGQKNHYHRHQKALWRCGLNPFFKVSVTMTKSQHVDKQIFKKTRWQWQTFCNFLFF